MTEFEDRMNRAVEQGVIPGAVLLAADMSGRLKYAKQVGYTTVDSKEPLEFDDIFTLASCTKLLTTIAALQLIEGGLIGLDDDVSQLIPGLANQQVLIDIPKNGSPIFQQRKNPITLRLLLTHSSGAGYDFADRMLTQYLHSYTPRDVLKDATVDARFNSPLLYQPGEGWAYGSSIAYAGQVTEAISGMTLEGYMQKNIFEPLGIADITFFPARHLHMAGRLLRKGIRDVTGKVVDGPPGLAPLLGELEDCFGGEGAYGSLPDYLKILQSLLLDDERLLKKETTALMFQPQLSPASKQALTSFMVDPSPVVGDFTGPNEYDWGLGGILIDGDSHPYRRRNCLIWSGALNLFWFIDRTAGVCGIFGTQVWPPADPLVEPLLAAFEKDVRTTASTITNS
ncbi:uncharacterized protein HMPREF1541_08995 [Cyphellophora europaea CBS 101466]|uniref:Beta-lactamase-related domain-containing protein n=1 Tax=Cyphellophora europaea (strain CBS 101466) TaxID=1220924 RepID=W2RJP5_CYPE1|nr:uncharacterized protein HMPREF1541_08995 [Cyphellophora europaea CBS 101466]ETN36717.1 hypothetical protein HMPREF1541_08995 [Cyphellophora europaea CBS 101466]